MNALAYFITFTTYGTRLHGDERGSVDRDHNRYGDELLPTDTAIQAHERNRMRQESYTLDGPRRTAVLNAICQHAGYRKWTLYAAHVRTNHVHIVVSATVNPERVMDEFKAYASRALNRAGFESKERRRWTRHGSTRHLFTDEALRETIQYTVFEQGVLLSVFVSPLDANANANVDA